MVARMAAATDPAYAVNVAALEQAQFPKDLDASEIDVRLGATWIDKDYIQQFMEETFDTPWRLRNAVQVKYSPPPRSGRSRARTPQGGTMSWRI